MNTIHEFIGQKNIVKELSVHLLFSNIWGKPLEHTMFYGQAGLGKTTLAELTTKTLGTNFIQKTGKELKISILQDILENIRYCDVLFIDEIHRVKIDTQEILYGPIQNINNLQKDFIRNKMFPSEFIWENKLYKPFTLIGATTSAGMLTKPMRDRFIHAFELKLYTSEEIESVLMRNGCNSQCSKIIAKRSRGVPRIAISFLIKAHNQGLYVPEIRPKDCYAVFDYSGIDELGLNPTDLSILYYLAENGETGEQVLSLTLGIDIESLIYIHEPYLMSLNFIKRTTKGRQITKQGLKYIGKK